jgi:hypothetical protein
MGLVLEAKIKVIRIQNQNENFFDFIFGEKIQFLFLFLQDFGQNDQNY